VFIHAVVCHYILYHLPYFTRQLTLHVRYRIVYWAAIHVCLIAMQEYGAWRDVPDNILLEIFQFLPAADLAVASQVSCLCYHLLINALCALCMHKKLEDNVKSGNITGFVRVHL